MHQLTFGDFELTSVSDGSYHLDGGTFFGVIPKSLWQRKVTPDHNNLIPTGLNSVVVRTGDHTVLIETGIGNKLTEKMIKIYGQPAQLLNNLSAAGIAPDDIDIVINTHLHFDHCGWNTLIKGSTVVPTFPRAQYYVQEGEWQYSRGTLDRDAISYISANYDPLIRSGQMTLLKGDQEIVPGISVEVFSGHTRDMQAVILRSGAKTACYISDLIPTTAHIDLVWGMAFDLYPLETITNKKRYYARAMPEKWLTMFTHDPNVPWGYVEQDAKGKMAVVPV